MLPWNKYRSSSAWNQDQVILLQRLMKRASSLSKSWLPKMRSIRKWRKRQKQILNLFCRQIKTAKLSHIAYGTDRRMRSKKFPDLIKKHVWQWMSEGSSFEEKNIIAYSSALGIGRLIYQLPIPLCKMFIKEIFDGQITG